MKIKYFVLKWFWKPLGWKLYIYPCAIVWMKNCTPDDYPEYIEWCKSLVGKDFVHSTFEHYGKK